MSRYEKDQTINGLTNKIAYGHDHAIGYFVQIYSPPYDEPVVEYDDLFGWHDKSATVEQRKVASALVKDIKAETVSTERMDRDPRNHLGARIAADIMPTKGNA